MRGFLCLGAVLLFGAGLTTSIASAAPLEITEFSGSLMDSGGNREVQAGAHPDQTTTIRFATEIDFQGRKVPTANVRDVIVDLPPGVVGNPNVAPVCSPTELARQFSPECDQDTQVGVATVDLSFPGGTQPFPYPAQIYNVEPPRGVAARFGFSFLGVISVIDAVIGADGEYHVQARSLNASQGLAISVIKIRFWGVPSDSANDDERGECIFGGSCPSTLPRAAFISSPTSCESNPLRTTVALNSWQQPERILTGSFDEDTFGFPLRMEGCERLGFSPRIDVQGSSRGAGAPSGLAVHLAIPQSNDPDGFAAANLKDVAVTFPQGMAINPSSANGLAACADPQLGLGSVTPSTCPDAAKIGRATLTTPLLEEPLTGAVLLRPQASSDPSSGEMFRIALELANAERGVDVKLPGQIVVSPVDGQITARFPNNPQLPFSDLDLQLNQGPRSPLVNPPTCGTSTITAQFTSWAGGAATSRIPYTVDTNCAEGSKFNPGLEAGTTDPVGGKPSPFILRVTRPDGQQNVSRIQTTLPEGLLAKLAGVPICGDVQAVSGDCPAASRVGTTVVGAGPGTNPIYVPEPGKAPTAVYLAGPYKGAPYSLVVKVPAQAGPFDLGAVAIRNALYIDPTTAQVTANSDPLPQILQGVPISYRDIRIEIDRADFTLNPTSCEAMKVTSTIVGSAGAEANPSSRFRVGNCGELGFKPTLALELAGAVKRTGNPALTATLKAPKGQANIAKTTVILPRTQFIDNAHLNNPCTRVQFNANACPASSILGRATAYTPLLDKPLSGPVYFRSNGGERELPDLVADLDGQIHITLVGYIDSVKVKGTESSRVRTRFVNVPDAPVSKFVLKLKGGRKGLIENSVNLCKGAGRATVQMEGQNGKANEFDLALGTGCKKGMKK